MSNPNDYVVGWICAISTELVAARAFLDEEHDPPNAVSPRDNNIYTLGKMGNHNIVIAALPDGEYGISAAASVARDMLHSFPNVRIGLMVGIGGGVPGRHDIRLGDVVVSATRNEQAGIFQYDFGKTIQAQEFQNTMFLNQPPALLRSAVGGLKADYESNGHQFQEAMKSILAKKPKLRKKYQRPDPKTDRLYLNYAVHPLTSNEGCAIACSDLMLMPREQRAEDEDDPTIHYGLIASGNQLMNDALTRDQLAFEKDVLCFEMEAAGLMNHFPCLVIRGICDYSDSHKNKIWQGYAAMTAAAYAEDLVGRIPPTKIEAENRIADVLSGMKQSVDRLVSVYHDQRNIDILNWLTPFNYSAQLSDYLRRRQQGTGEWLLRSSQFQMWLKNENQTLFCPGMPGAGKTIQTSVVVDHLQSSFQEDQKAGIAYFFFDYKRQDEQTINALLALFLKQLAASQSSLPEEVHKLYEKHNTQDKQTRPSTEELIGVLKFVITIYSRTFIMIDALDECKLSNGTRLILSCIYKLRSETKANFFITSRFNEEISGAFSGIPTLEIRASDEDVQRYLRRNMVYLPKFVYKDPSLQKEIIDSILKAVQGMFLVAQFHLGSLRGKTTPNQITLALQNLATGSDAYEQIYTKTMERIVSQYKEHKQLASSILSWLTFSKRPMRVAELQHVLGVKPKESYFDKRNMPSIEIMVSVCAGLVTIDNDSNIIRLVHYTTQQYFQQTFEKWLPESQCELTITCITYFSYNVFKLKASRSDRETLGSHPFYDYALLYWGDHAREDSVLREAVMEFLKDTKRIESYYNMWEVLPYPSVFSFSGLDCQNTGLHLAAWFGLTAAVDQLLKSNTDIAATNEDGETALAIAAGRNHKGVAQLLIDNKADIEANCRFNCTPLHIAAHEGHEDIVQLLLDNNADIEAVDDYGSTPLDTAIMYNKTDVVQLLLDRDPDIKTADKDGYTPLQLAVAHVSEPEITALLLSKGAQVDAPCIGQNGKTPLLMIVRNELYPHWSIGEYETDIAQLLLRYGADIKAVDEDGNTALHLSAEWNLELTELLLIHGAEVNATNDYGETPLFGAIISEHGELSMPVIQLLLTNGADVNIARYGGWTPLHVAAFTGSQEAITELLNKGANVNATDEDGRTPLFNAADSDFWDKERESVIQLLLDNGANVNAIDNNGKTPLLCSIKKKRNSKQQAFRFLLINGANINAADESGNTLLHQAVKSGCEVEVRLLLSHGANVHATNKSVKTPLFYATCNSRCHLVELMLDHGANVQVTDENGNTPLHHAVQNKYHDESITAKLLNKGAKVNAVNNDGRTPLFDLIVSAKDFGLNELEPWVTLLLDYGADLHVEAAVREGETPLHLAAMCNNTDCTRLLLKHKADLKDTDHRGNTLLHGAAYHGAWGDVKLLLKWHARINATNTNGRTALHQAVSSDSTAYHNVRSEKHEMAVKVLVNSGANIEAADKDGKTPLHLAIESRHKDAARFLLKKKAKVNATDLSGKTPLFYAIECLRLGETPELIEQLVQLLLDYGANVLATDNLGRTVKDVAIEKKCYSVITLLIRARDSNIVGSRSPSSLGEDEEMDDEEDDEEDGEEEDEEDDDDEDDEDGETSG